MGINIHCYKLVDKELEDPPFQWDSMRYSGDRDFAIATPHVYSERADPDDGPLWRPKDFKETREWIDKNIEPEGNRARLFKLMDDLEANPDCWMYSSY